MGNSHLLFESVFKRELSAAGTWDYLAQITTDHPYFTPAQFFLLLKTGKGTASYNDLAAKTALLFNNPYWLQFQLQEGTGEIPEEADKFVPTENLENIFEIKEPVETADNKEAIIIIGQPEKEIITGNSLATANDELIITPRETNIDVIIQEENHLLIEETAAKQPGGTEPGHVEGNSQRHLAKESIIPGQDNNLEETVIEEEMLTVLNSYPELSTLAEKGKDAIIDEKETGAANNESEVSTVTANADEITEPLYTVQFNEDKSPLVNEEETEEAAVPEIEIEPLNFRLNIETADTTEEKITFEPLHTSDYFASLGIKLSGEIKSSDKLGKHLKSFTEWLKTMKKIHSDQLPPLTGVADLSIQQLAEQSNMEDAVITEAMADVLLLQGKTEKARDVYKKLSLLNPSKSTYFAAKIDQLKEP